LKSWGHSKASVIRAEQVGISLGPTAYKNFSLRSAPTPSGNPLPAAAVGVDGSANEHPAMHNEVARGDAWEVSSEQTVLTINTADLEQGIPFNFAEVLDRCFDIRERPILKTDHAFSEFVRDHLARLHSDISRPLLESLPLENKLAPTFNGDDVDKSEGLKRGYKMLKSVAFELFNSESLKMFFRASSPQSNTPEGLLRAFDESIDIVANDLAEAIAPELKELLSAQRRVWKKSLGKSSEDSGCHAAAAQLRQSFLEVTLEACSKVEVEAVAKSAWVRQREVHRKAEKEEQKAAADEGGNTAAADKKKYKFKNRQRGSDRKTGMQDELYQKWSGDPAAEGFKAR